MQTLTAFNQLQESAEHARCFIELARQRNAHLDLVVVGQLPTITATPYPGMVGFYSDESHTEIMQEANDRVDELELLAQQEGISASITMQCRELSMITDMVPGYTMFSDAAIFRNGSILGDEMNRRLFDSALLKSARPVLMLDERNQFPTEARRVLFAWNGEPESARALHNASAWLSKGTNVNVTSIDPAEYRFGPNPGDDAAAFLARRHFDVTVDLLPSKGRDIADILLEHATDIDADLIIMGAYGHTRMREWLIGGTTRSILMRSNLPVFMAN